MVAFILLLFLFSFHEVQGQQKYSNISLGSSLSPSSNSSWLSASGRYAFGFYREDNGFALGVYFAQIPEKTVVWTALRDDSSSSHIVPGNATLLLTIDGRLILQAAEGREINVASATRVVSASMLDDGNFVLYSPGQKIVWQSFDSPTDTLLPGQRLSAGHRQLFSRASEMDYSRGIFRLNMQRDGNLVQYPIDTEDYWYSAYFQSDTDGLGEQVTLNLEKNGHLFLSNSTHIIKNITQGGFPNSTSIYLMRLDVDGIFRVYSLSLDKGNWSKVWSSTDDGCTPKGRCGLNAFCVLMDQDASCQCLPGFDFISKGKESSGCVRNFTEAICKETDPSISYTMRRLENTHWESSRYAILAANTVEDCERNCLEDCNCEVALFKNQECRKQKLPLRFGRRDPQDPNIALIKMRVPASIGAHTPTSIVREIRKEERTTILIVIISLMFLAILGLAGSVIILYRTRQWAYKKIKKTRNVVRIDDVALHAFSYVELVEITDGFKEEIGKGAFGTVYKGTLSNSQRMVAVKKLENELEDGEREFQTEMKVIGKTHHKNLVHLVGYCIDGSKRLLVYEFMSNGSLADVLFTPVNRLSWLERIKIATDVARGILYLHDECETKIIHCDIKPQNILMDENMCAKISDFGLAKLLKQDQTKTYTGARGTKGYVAPEWHRKMPVNVKVDVYSFGVVLLEIICCRRNVNCSLPEDEVVLEDWVYDCFVAGDLRRVVPDEEVHITNLERFIKIAIWCIQEEPSLRPSMKKVMTMLDSPVDIPLPPNPSSFLGAF